MGWRLDTPEPKDILISDTVNWRLAWVIGRNDIRRPRYELGGGEVETVTEITWVKGRLNNGVTEILETIRTEVPEVIMDQIREAEPPPNTKRWVDRDQQIFDYFESIGLIASGTVVRDPA